jgi:hypothetical protein
MNLAKIIALILTGSLITFCNLHCAAERYQRTEAAHSEEDQLQEALRLSRNEYRRQQIREAEQREEADLQEALKISAQEEIERQRQIQAREKIERYDYIVLYNANVPIENIELRQGASTTIGRPRSPFNAPKDRSIWEIPVEHGATGPFILTVKTNTMYHRWEIPEFKPSSDKELGIIQNEEKQEIVLQQIIETSTGYRAHGINAHDIIP